MWQELSIFCAEFLKLCSHFTTGLWHMKWVCGFTGFVISITYKKAKQSHQCLPWRRELWSDTVWYMPFPRTNSLEKAATGENQKFHLVCRQWSVQTVGCWQSSPEDHAVCPVLTRGSWPCSEADHQMGRLWHDLATIPVFWWELSLFRAHHCAGICLSQCVCMSWLPRSHKSTRFWIFSTSFSSLLFRQLCPFIFLFFH